MTHPVIWKLYVANRRGGFSLVFEGEGRKEFRKALEGLGRLTTCTKQGHTYYATRRDT
jgi:hypothetical protein